MAPPIPISEDEDLREYYSLNPAGGTIPDWDKLTLILDLLKYYQEGGPRVSVGNRDPIECPGDKALIELAHDQYGELIRELDIRPTLKRFVENYVRYVDSFGASYYYICMCVHILHASCQFLRALRYDYDPRMAIITFRMQRASIHEASITLIKKEINTQLERLAAIDNSHGAFAAQIRDATSSRILFRTENPDSGIRGFIRREPDAQFKHIDAIFPGVIFEVSQHGEDFEQLASDYITCSGGDIKAVIGIILNDGGTRQSTITLWRTCFVRDQGNPEAQAEVRHEIEHEVSQLWPKACERYEAELQTAVPRCGRIVYESRGVSSIIPE